MDDYWVGKEYMLDESNYQRIVHELLNWMKDMEFAFVHSNDPYNEDFFPSFGVEERMI